MRVNANKNVHQMKRDPYKTLMRVALILLAVVLLGAVAYYLCSLAITNDYAAKRDEIIRQNEENEIAFNTRMNELRSSQNAFFDVETGEVVTVELPYWENTIDGALWRIEDDGKTAPENTHDIVADRNELMLGGLMLINAWHPLPSEFSDEALVAVGSTSGYKIPVTDNSVKLFRPAYDALFEALEIAAGQGLENYLVQEGYRSNDAQTELFNKRMAKLQDKYSGDILIEQTKKEVNYPGTSEYQTGFSFSMRLYPNPDDLEFVESPQGKWMVDNSWRYGMVFRFPTKDFPDATWEDKSYKTAVSIELNLFRYVGKAHAAAMRVMNFCLEEYVEFLMEHPHISIYEDGALKYEIYRIADTKEASFNLPVPNPSSSYQASFDNMGGIVLAYSY
ncbi:MAG: D-alanyl-D-alanine carboxypeptidase family protein [Clostridiales bacterium]|nr:D-alanyl-D-alanine carboxypeptidase family protein [Clostridiales bacterium]